MKKLTIIALVALTSIQINAMKEPKAQNTQAEQEENIPLKFSAIKQAINRAKEQERHTTSNISKVDQEMSSLARKMQQKQGDDRFSGAIEKAMAHLKILQERRSRLETQLNHCRQNLARAHRALKRKYSQSINKHREIYNNTPAPLSANCAE